LGRQAQHPVNLLDGKRVGFSLNQRDNDPNFFVRFKAPDGRYPERSTGAAKKSDALVAAEIIVRLAYNALAQQSDACTWADAEERLKAKWIVMGRRATTLESYLRAIRMVREFFPETTGPEDITAKIATAWRDAYGSGSYQRSKKEGAVKRARSGFTINSKLLTLNAIWGTWFGEELGIVTSNPWAKIDVPKLDKLPPHIPADADVEHFLAWLKTRFNGWTLPLLFFEVKAHCGNRLWDLCALKSVQLQHGKIMFPPNLTKGRKARHVPLSPYLFAELQALAGPTFLWERHPMQLKPILKAKGWPTHRIIDEFHPRRFYAWVESLMADYRKDHPERPKLTTHGFRKRAFTAAWKSGVDPRRAAIAYGCGVDTIMRYYVGLDEQQTTDEVFKLVLNNPKPTENSLRPTEKRPD
jgi:integrase